MPHDDVSYVEDDGVIHRESVVEVQKELTPLIIGDALSRRKPSFQRH